MGNPWCTRPGWKRCGSITLACISRHPLIIVIPLNNPLWTRKTLMVYQDQFMRLVTCKVFHLDVRVPRWALQKISCSELCRMLAYVWMDYHPHIWLSCQGRSETASHCTHSLSLCLLCLPTRCDGSDGFTSPSAVVLLLFYRRLFGSFLWKIHKHAAELCQSLLTLIDIRLW